MPSMQFPLDIIFLDGSQKVVGIERNVPIAKAGAEMKDIPTTEFYMAQDVLELRVENTWSRDLQVGDQISWCH